MSRRPEASGISGLRLFRHSSSRHRHNEANLRCGRAHEAWPGPPSAARYSMIAGDRLHDVKPRLGRMRSGFASARVTRHQGQLALGGLMACACVAPALAVSASPSQPISGRLPSAGEEANRRGRPASAGFTSAAAREPRQPGALSWKTRRWLPALREQAASSPIFDYGQKASQSNRRGKGTHRENAISKHSG